MSTLQWIGALMLGIPGVIVSIFAVYIVVSDWGRAEWKAVGGLVWVGLGFLLIVYGCTTMKAVEVTEVPVVEKKEKKKKEKVQGCVVVKKVPLEPERRLDLCQI